MNDVVEGEALVVVEERKVVESLVRGEVDMQVSTAKRFPRSVKTFLQSARTMATLDEETAASCFYVLPRKGRDGEKNIEGPSTRLAEIVASSWGNLRCETRVVDETERFVVAQATAWDMERNVLVRTEVRRGIINKYGKRYNDDMINMTANGAASIAFRNAVFKVVPAAYVNQVYQEARKTAVGDQKTLAQRRDSAFAYWLKAGVEAERVLAVLGKPAIEDVDLDDLAILKGLHTAVKEGTTTLDEAFPSTGVELKAGKHFGFGEVSHAV